MKALDARLFPKPRGWTERIGMWLCRWVIEEAEQRHANLGGELERNRSASAEVGARLRVAQSTIYELERDLLELKTRLEKDGGAFELVMALVHGQGESMLLREQAPGNIVPIKQPRPERSVQSEAAKLAELKYRQLKEHVQHLKAELRDSGDSSAYLECLELFGQIPQLRHIATRYLHEQDAKAIDADVRSVLIEVPWLGRMAALTADDIGHVVQPEDKHVQPWDAERDARDNEVSS